MNSTTLSFLLVCAGTLTGFLTIGIPLPVIPDFIHDQLGFSMIVTGAAIGLQSLATVLTRRSAGHRADTRGGRVTARRGLITCAAAGVIYLASTLAARGSTSAALALFLGGRVVLGWGESLLLTGALTWGIGLVGAQRTGKVMSWNGIAMHAALALGAPLGMWVRQRFGFTAVSGLALIAPLLGYVATHFVRGTDDARVPSLERAFGRTVRTIWAEGLGVALGTIAFGTLSGFIAVYFRGHGWPFAGQALMVFGACYISVRLMFGGWPDRVGGARVAACSLGVEALGQGILWWADSPLLALAGVALTGAGYSLIVPSFGVQALKRVSPERRGTALGAFSAFFDVALGTTGPVCGVMITTFGVSSIYGVGFVATLGALALLAIAHRTRPGAVA